MEKMVILGGTRLEGEVNISGAKNSAVGIIPAAILVAGQCRIENVPAISDISNILTIFKKNGGKVKHIGKSALELDSSGVMPMIAPCDEVRKSRASSYFMGAMLGRFHEINIDFPGGCDFGVRPIDQHVKGFESLGAKVSVERGILSAKCKKLTGATVYLDVVSVGATINIMLAAVLADGLTIIENAAKEPHVVDIANFLNTMGAMISGAGTDVIKIRGVEKLSGGTYSLIPDQIEAGTFMIAAAATHGSVVVRNIIPKHLDSVTAKLIESGAKVEEYGDALKISTSARPGKISIKTLPYPGFPTDLQPQMLAMLSLADGTSIVSEGVWDNRFGYVDELRKMGASISVDGKVAIVEGVKKITGSPVYATDLRAGAALIIAGLSAQGITEIYNLKYIDRGYENLEKKLKSLGAQVARRADEKIIGTAGVAG